MQYFADARLDNLIAEDIPYIDLTCSVLGISDKLGKMSYYTREDCILAGVAPARRIMDKLGCEVVTSAADGQKLKAGETFFVVQGPAESLHAAWKVCLNLFDHLSAVATKTRSMVDAVHEANPDCEVLTTRKSMPGVKDLLVHAVTVGGAFPHRLGLSETVLVFDQHIECLGGFDEFLNNIPQIKRRCIEKKLFVEAGPERALLLAKAGVDGIQLDKVPVDQLPQLVNDLRAVNPNVTVIAAGGINPKNARAYAETGVDGLVTTSLFTAPPLDMSIRMRTL